MWSYLDYYYYFQGGVVHRIGSMTPDVGQSAHFLQIYFHVGSPEKSEIDVRLDAFEGQNGLDARDKRLIEELQVCKIIFIIYIFV